MSHCRAPRPCCPPSRPPVPSSRRVRPGRARPVASAAPRELGALLRLSRVLRPARGRATTSAPSPASRSRPARRTSGATSRCCRCPTDVAEHPEHRARASPGWSGPTTSPASWASKTLWVKDDSGNPTHSFKDRVVAVALTAARELGFTVLACPSTGNLANAVAAAAARAGIRSVVLIPNDLERPKVVTTAVYGGTLVAVDGNYDDVNRLASEIAGEEEDWAFVNVNVRPVLRRGLQDARLRGRRAARLAAARAGRRPGRVRLAADQDRQGLPRAGRARPGRGHAVPDLRRAGRPAARRSRAAFKDGHDVVRPVRPDTIAKSLAIGNPADGPYVLDVARRTGGAVEDVTDDEIRDGIRLLARTEGIFAETAGGVTVATLKKLRRDRPARPRRRDRRLQHRRRAQDPRRRRRPGRARPRPSRPTYDAFRPPPASGPGMSVQVRVPTILRTYTGGARRSPPRARPRRGHRHPGARTRASARVVDEQGQLRRFVNVYVGQRGRAVRRRPRDADADGAQLSIIPAVAGG